MNKKEDCFDAERIAAYVEGRLHGEELAIMERHFEVCKSCRDIVHQLKADAVRLAEESRPRRRPR